MVLPRPGIRERVLQQLGVGLTRGVVLRHEAPPWSDSRHHANVPAAQWSSARGGSSCSPWPGWRSGCCSCWSSPPPVPSRTSAPGPTGRDRRLRARRASRRFRTRMIFHPPLYPYFLAVPYSLFGTLDAAKWAQAIVAALLIPAVGRVGAMVFGARAGLAAAALCGLLPGARLVLRPLLGGERLPRPPLVGVRASLRGGREAAAAAPPSRPACCGASRSSRARRASTSCRSRARGWPGGAAARGRACARGAVRADRAADGRALDVPQLGRVRRVRSRLHRGRAEPVPGQRAPHAPGGLRPLRGRAGPHRAVPLRRSGWAWQAIRDRQPAWLVEKLVEQMPMFWEAESMAVIHVKRGAYGPVRPAGGGGGGGGHAARRTWPCSRSSCSASRAGVGRARCCSLLGSSCTTTSSTW